MFWTPVFLLQTVRFSVINKRERGHPARHLLGKKIPVH